MLKKLFLMLLIILSFNLYSDTPEELISGELFPVDYQKGIYHVNKNFPAIILLKFTGAAALEKIKNPKIIIDMPEGYSCLGVCPRFGNSKGSDNKFTWKMEKMEFANIEKDGSKYTRYTVMLSESIVERFKPEFFRWGHFVRIYIKTTAPHGIMDKKNAYIKIAADNWTGPEKKIELIQVPELSTNSPVANKFGMLISGLASMTVPDDEISDAYTNYWKSLSAKSYSLSFGWNSIGIGPELRKKITSKFNMMFITDSMPGGTVTIYDGNLKKWVNSRIASNAKIKPRLMVTVPDKADKINAGDKVLLCPGYLASDTFYWDDYVAPLLKKHISDMSISGIIYDIEPGAMDFCFCENCLKDFKDSAKLEKIPSVEEIQKKYSSEWFNFRVAQNAAFIKAFCNCVKKNFPGKQAIVCTEPLHSSGETLAKWCGVDPRLSDKDADLFMNMPYYSGTKYYDDTELNNKALKTPNFPLNDPSERIISCFTQYTPEKIKQNIVVTAALGCKGFGFWPDDVLDGKYLLEIQKAYAVVAKAEDYYFAKRNDSAVSLKPEIFFEKTIADEGQNITLKFPDSSDALRWTVHEKDGNFLVTVINYAPSEFILTLKAATLENYAYNARDIEDNGLFYKDKNALLGTDDIKKGFMVNVPGNSLKVIEITKNDVENTADKTKAIYQDELKQKLADMKKNFPEDILKEVKTATSGISWGVLIDQKLPLVKMTSGDYKIYINTSKGAEIVSWNDKKKLNDILFFKDRGFFDNLILSDDTKGKGEYRFSLGKAFIDNKGNPVAVFKYTVSREDGANPEEGPLENLEVEKQTTLQNQGKTINIKYVFTNKSKSRKSMLLGFRIKNFPRTTVHPENGELLSKMSKISFETMEGVKTIEAGNNEADNVILQADAKMPGFLNIKPKPLKWKNSPIKIDVQSGNRKEHFEVIPDKSNSSGFFVWWSDKFYTLELLSNEKVLKYNESISYEYNLSR